MTHFWYNLVTCAEKWFCTTTKKDHRWSAGQKWTFWIHVIDFTLRRLYLLFDGLLQDWSTIAVAIIVNRSEKNWQYPRETRNIVVANRKGLILLYGNTKTYKYRQNHFKKIGRVLFRIHPLFTVFVDLSFSLLPFSRQLSQ